MIPEKERLVILQLFDVLLARSRGEAMRGEAWRYDIVLQCCRLMPAGCTQY